MKRRRENNKSYKYTKRRKTYHGTPKRLGYVPRPIGDPSYVTERKYFDTELSTATVASGTTDWTGTEDDPVTILTFCAPVTGNDFNQRVGRKITIKSWKMRGFFRLTERSNQTAALAVPMIRSILYVDTATNTVQAQGEDVMASGASSIPFAMFQNPANFGRFRVLKDKVFRFPTQAIAFDGTNIEENGQMVPFKYNIKFRKPLVVHFNGTNGGTVADIVDNSLHMISLANNADMACTVSYKSRVTYLDG